MVFWTVLVAMPLYFVLASNTVNLEAQLSISIQESSKPAHPPPSFSFVYLQIPQATGTAITSILGDLFHQTSCRHVALSSTRLPEPSRSPCTFVFPSDKRDGPLDGYQVLANISQTPALRPQHIMGSVGHGLCPWTKNPANCIYSAVVRDPIARFISEYQQMVRHREVRMYCPRCRNVSEFAEYVFGADGVVDAQRADIRPLLPRFDNVQTLYLSSHCYMRMRFSLNGSEADPGHGACPYAAVDEATFRSAMRNLDAITVLGILEDLPTYVDLLYETFGLKWPKGKNIYVDLRRNDASVLTPRARGILARALQWDMKLYEEVKKKMAMAALTRDLFKHAQSLEFQF